jgi:uncharacterized small protein (DUF1192 family)
MRTIIDITQEQVKALDEISELEGTSRTALIRQAIDRMLAEDARKGETAQAAFGLWSARKNDGLEMEATLRLSIGAAKAPAPAKPDEVVQRVAPPPVIEDAFVTAPEPKLEKAPEAIADAPSVREASMTTVDPLSAFFAGVKP